MTCIWALVFDFPGRYIVDSMVLWSCSDLTMTLHCHLQTLPASLSSRHFQIKPRCPPVRDADDEKKVQTDLYNTHTQWRCTSYNTCFVSHVSTLKVFITARAPMSPRRLTYPNTTRINVPHFFMHWPFCFPVTAETIEILAHFSPICLCTIFTLVHLLRRKSIPRELRCVVAMPDCTWPVAWALDRDIYADKCAASCMFTQMYLNIPTRTRKKSQIHIHIWHKKNHYTNTYRCPCRQEFQYEIICFPLPGVQSVRHMPCGLPSHQRFRRQTGTPQSFLHACSPATTICTLHCAFFAPVHLQIRHLMDTYMPKLHFGYWICLRVIGPTKIEITWMLIARIHVADISPTIKIHASWLHTHVFTGSEMPRRAERWRSVPCWKNGDAE